MRDRGAGGGGGTGRFTSPSKAMKVASWPSDPRLVAKPVAPPLRSDPPTYLPRDPRVGPSMAGFPAPRAIPIYDVPLHQRPSGHVMGKESPAATPPPSPSPAPEPRSAVPTPFRAPRPSAGPSLDAVGTSVHTSVPSVHTSVPSIQTSMNPIAEISVGPRGSLNQWLGNNGKPGQQYNGGAAQLDQIFPQKPAVIPQQNVALSSHGAAGHTVAPWSSSFGGTTEGRLASGLQQLYIPLGVPTPPLHPSVALNPIPYPGPIPQARQYSFATGLSGPSYPAPVPAVHIPAKPSSHEMLHRSTALLPVVSPARLHTVTDTVPHLGEANGATETSSAKDLDEIALLRSQVGMSFMSHPGNREVILLNNTVGWGLA